MSAKRIDYVMDCPGSWYGNNPTDTDGRGNVAVDPGMVKLAILWLQKRVVIHETRVIRDSSPDGAAILISFSKRSGGAK